MPIGVMVTGAAGHLGRQIVAALLAQANVDRVIAVDLACLADPSVTEHRKCTFLQADVRDAAVLEAAASCSLIIHCAWLVVRAPQTWRRLSRPQRREAQVTACAQLLRAQAKCPQARFVFLSSAIVYGLDHAQPVSEQHPLMGVDRCDYACDKLAAEQWLAAYQREHTTTDIIVLRPGIILDRDCQPLLRQLLLSPIGLRHSSLLRSPVPWVWSGDVVQALLTILHTPAQQYLAGAYNLATRAHLSPAQAQAYLGRQRWQIPASLGLWALSAVWRWQGGKGQAPWSALAAGGLRLDCSAARRHLGWRPQRDTWRTLDSLLEDDHGGYPALQKTPCRG